MARQRKPVEGETGAVESPDPERSLAAQIADSYAGADAPTHGAIHNVEMALTDLKARAAGLPHLPRDIADRIASL
jgi:L-alanine-DL-glutamate epimerase-like enolase superfamily enzyme